MDWEQRLYQELRRCQALLIVLTPAWLDSKWCGNELAIAREKGKAVFVVRVAACEGGTIIPAIQEVDITVDQESALTKLARGLKEHGLDHPAPSIGSQADQFIQVLLLSTLTMQQSSWPFRGELAGRRGPGSPAPASDWLAEAV